MNTSNLKIKDKHKFNKRQITELKEKKIIDDWEHDFLMNIRDKRFLSDKQKYISDRIINRVLDDNEDEKGVKNEDE